MKLTLLFLMHFFAIQCLHANIPNFVSANSDYFRSTQDGAWNTLSTWQSSTDSVTWVAATLIPDVNSARVSIFDSVYSVQSVSIDQLTIETGGVLTNNAVAGSPGAITILNGPGDDFTIKNGGIYYIVATVAFGAHTTLSTGSRTLVMSGGMVRIGNGSAAVGGSNHSIGTTSAASLNTFWENDAVLEWNSITPPTFANVTFFTNSLDNTTPIFRIKYPFANLGGALTTPLYINGRLETMVKVTISSTGFKLFRGGVINHDTLFVKGKLYLEDGLAQNNCKLGGLAPIVMLTDSLHVKGVNQFKVDLQNDKTIIGNIALENVALFNLNGDSLIVDGRVAGGAGDPLRFFNTDFNGVLKIMRVGNEPVVFPVGNRFAGSDIFNQVTLTNNGTVDNFSVTATQQYPVCLNTMQRNSSVKAQWDITEDVQGGSDVQMQLIYGIDGIATSDVGGGYSALTAKIIHCKSNMEADFASGTVNGTTITATGSGFKNFSPFGITSDATLLQYLPLLYARFNAHLNNQNDVVLTWNNNISDSIQNFDIERSNDGIVFNKISNIIGNRQSYQVTDFDAIEGNNYYRIKAYLNQNRIHYSSVKMIKRNGAKLIVSSVFPTVVQSEIYFNTQYVKQANAVVGIYDVKGVLHSSKSISVSKTLTRNFIDTESLPVGTYILKINCDQKQFVTQFTKLQ